MCFQVHYTGAKVFDSTKHIENVLSTGISPGYKSARYSLD